MIRAPARNRVRMTVPLPIRLIEQHEMTRSSNGADDHRAVVGGPGSPRRSSAAPSPRLQSMRSGSPLAWPFMRKPAKEYHRQPVATGGGLFVQIRRTCPAGTERRRPRARLVVADTHRKRELSERE